MNTITIWIEGYPGMYNEKAALFAIIQATDLDTAIHNLLESKTRGSEFIQKDNKNNWHIFGCRLFDNEKDAKKRNG